MAAIKFAGPEELPEGFLYRNEFLSELQEAELLGICRGLDFAAYEYHGYLAKRRVVRYGANYDSDTREESEAQPIPRFLAEIRARAAELAEVGTDEMVQAMISEYSPGTPIGWHRDAPQFGVIIGISLGSACRMRLKPYQVRRELPSDRSSAEGGGTYTNEGSRTHIKILSLRLDPRSIYVMRGQARSQWQHSIPAVEEMRYSITFRTLRFRTKRQAA